MVLLGISGLDPALSNPSYVELNCEAHAVPDGVDDSPRARAVIVRQLRVKAAAVERVARLFGEYEYEASASDVGVAALPLATLGFMALSEDLLGHALLIGDRSLEPVAKGVVIEVLGHHIDVAARLPTKEYAARRRPPGKGCIRCGAVDPGGDRDKVVPSPGP